MFKKLVIAILLAICAFGAIFAKLMIFDDKYVGQISTEDNFKKNIQKSLMLIPLDYMNSKEVELCNVIKDTLRKNADNMQVVSPQNASDIGELYNTVPSKCTKEEFEEIFATKESGYEYLYYKLDIADVLILIKSPNSALNHITALSKEKCIVDEEIVKKSLIVSENTMLVKIENQYYLISEWFSPEKYVFYSLEKSPEYDGVICRFNLDDNV